MPTRKGLTLSRGLAGELFEGLRLAVHLGNAMRHKGDKKYSPPFVRLSKDLLFKRSEWWNLSPSARDVYFLLKAKYNGSNNGGLRLYYSEIRRRNIRGLRSDKAISRAFQELETSGWIQRTRIGGLHRYVNEYRLTGKYDELI